MSRIGTKKPPIKNAYYARQEHVPAMNAIGKGGNDKAGGSNATNWSRSNDKSSCIEKD